MDKLSIDEIGTKLGLGDFLNDQTISLLASYGVNLLAGIVTLSVGIWLSRKAGTVTREWLTKLNRLDPTLIPMLGALVRYTGLTLTVVISLSTFGVETTSVIAVVGAAGLAIGLALQGTLSNVAAGLMLLFLRPFRIGDWVEAADVSGTVREIGLFTTVIDTFDNVYISIPNSSIWTSKIINHARYGTRRLDLDIGIGYTSSLDTAEKALLSLAVDPRVLPDPKPQFLVVSYGDSAINVRLRAYAKYEDFFPLFWDLNRRLKDVLDSHEIEIPFPQRVVHHHSEPQGDE
ncbi:mechanosensitive ion channel family protein [bacterium]|jgi:small conductance mechanosensitive channel|nr:mechanosensitive ion channel family protein [bacterium]